MLPPERGSGGGGFPLNPILFENVYKLNLYVGDGKGAIKEKLWAQKCDYR